MATDQFALVRYVAKPEYRLAREHQAAPCEQCAFVAPAAVCKVMRVRMVDMGLPDCQRGFVYQEEFR